jgi:hypothetical protein
MRSPSSGRATSSGGGAMPAGLVKGQQEKDVLAYLAGIISPP